MQFAKRFAKTHDHVIIHDQGREFNNHLVKDLCQRQHEHRDRHDMSYPLVCGWYADVAEVLGRGVYRMEKEDGVAIKQTVNATNHSAFSSVSDVRLISLFGHNYSINPQVVNLIQRLSGDIVPVSKHKSHR